MRAAREFGRVEDSSGGGAGCRADLLGGTWSISRRVFESNLQDVRDWLGESQPPTATNAERLALALESSWLSAELSARGDRRFRCVPRLDGHWISSGDRVALVACPAFEREWLAPAVIAAAKQKARLAIRSPGSRPVSSDEELRTGAAARFARGRSSSRMPRRPSDLRRLDGRRSVWLASLGALVLLLAAGAYLVTRAIGRELAVARLQPTSSRPCHTSSGRRSPRFAN